MTYHGHRRRLRLRPFKPVGQVADNYVIDKAGGIWSIYEATEEDTFRARKVITEPYRTEDSCKLDLPWHVAGVHRYPINRFLMENPYSTPSYYRFDGVDYGQTTVLPREDIVGKAMLCGDTLTEWLHPWFMSKQDG